MATVTSSLTVSAAAVLAMDSPNRTTLRHLSPPSHPQAHADISTQLLISPLEWVSVPAPDFCVCHFLVFLPDSNISSCPPWPAVLQGCLLFFALASVISAIITSFREGCGKGSSSFTKAPVSSSSMGWLFFTVSGSVPLVSNALELVPLAVAGSFPIPITSVSSAWCLSREKKSPKVPVSTTSSRPGTWCPRCCSTWSTSCTALKESPPQVRNSSAGDSASSSCPVAPWKARNKLLFKKKAWQEHRRTQIIHCHFTQPC